MPSHAAHLLFALECQKIPVQNEPTATIMSINHGAQLPDMFYHNRRTRPFGLYISVALHRRGFASMAAKLLYNAETKLEYQSALAFLSHGVLDRTLHPWINAFTGWFDPAVLASYDFRYRHPLLERLIDIYICHHNNAQWLLGSEFATVWGPQPTLDPLGENEFPGSAKLLTTLRAIYPRCAADTELEQRLTNAWRDSRGYYYWTTNLSTAEYNAERDAAFGIWQAMTHDQEFVIDDGALRFASIVHPRLPVDTAGNLPSILRKHFEARQTLWYDPCHDGPARSTSLIELWHQARAEMEKLVSIIGLEKLDLNSESAIQEALQDTGFHDGDLRSSQRASGDCRLEYCQPLDWFEIWFNMEGLIPTQQ